MVGKAKARRWNTAELQHAELKSACEFAGMCREAENRCEPVTTKAHAYDVPNDLRSMENSHSNFNVADIPFYRNIPFVKYITKEEVEFGG